MSGLIARVAPRLASFLWIPDVAVLCASVIAHALRPLNWRRTARIEFRRYLDIACFQQAPLVLLVAALIGVGLVLQALQLLRQLGQEDLVREVVIVLLVEQIAPVMIGLLIIGRSGLILFEELSAARRADLPHALDSMGVDPFIALVMPRCIAITASSFALTVFLVGGALVASYAGAKAAGFAIGSFAFAIDNAISGVGVRSLLLTGVKSLAIGLVVSCCFAHAALGEGVRRRHPLPTAFLRAFVAMLAVSVLITVIG